ncbi:menaquinone biosynthetic enzyme MqnA/MqnD family protein [Thermoplasma sp.]|uniref:menaquinone biosynthetic enzyme MqnA/MqnD family protein n=1 Tax=Thermoplasma sp. TaxID=1973142 RepID=UPI00126ECB50|nr:menaquinone biosynthetic enzyme MqnA/MqnD family protein [Thermoplasma sp.]KAA8922601.1 MAG: ABC transporter substrate-binding protein [Thermoplasma sp.]
MISIIDFAHSDPLYMGFENRDGVDRHGPFQNLELVLSGRSEIGMVSLVSYLENEDNLRLLNTANIHSKGKTVSTLLVSRKDGLKKKMDVAITRNTRTTELYLDLVLTSLHVEHRFIHTDYKDAEDLLTVADYALLNGDEALAVYAGRNHIIMDVGNAFSRIFHMAPVYAVSVSRISENPDTTELDHAVMRSIAYKMECARSLSERIGIPMSVAEDYYNTILYEYDNHTAQTIEFIRKIIRSTNGNKTSSSITR